MTTRTEIATSKRHDLQQLLRLLKPMCLPNNSAQVAFEEQLACDLQALEARFVDFQRPPSGR